MKSEVEFILLQEALKEGDPFGGIYDPIVEEFTVFRPGTEISECRVTPCIYFRKSVW